MGCVPGVLQIQALHCLEVSLISAPLCKCHPTERFRGSKRSGSFTQPRFPYSGSLIFCTISRIPFKRYCVQKSHAWLASYYMPRVIAGTHPITTWKFHIVPHKVCIAHSILFKTGSHMLRHLSQYTHRRTKAIL